MTSPPKPDLTTHAGRLVIATQMVHACVAALRQVPIADFVLLVMDDEDRLARVLGAHVARAAGDTEEPARAPQLHGRPVPRGILLEGGADLGEPLVRSLEAPLADAHMRVLWLAPGQHHVLDVAIDARQVVALEGTLSAEQVRDDLGIGEDELAAMQQERDVGGTWQDPARYLPMPIPPGWSLEGIDRLGVLTVLIEERLVLELGAMPAPQGELLFAVMRHAVSAEDVSDDEARRVLDRLRNVQRDFKELSGMGELFGDGRMWASRVLEGVRDVPGSA